MTRLFAGTKPGVGPVLKVMANDTDDPLTTPNTDYHKFRFNSEVQELAYAYGSVSYNYLGVTFSGLTGNFHIPTGSISTCDLSVYAVTVGSITQTEISWCFDRVTGLGYRSILMELRDHADWSSVWKTADQAYPGSSDRRYWSSSNNDVTTCDLNHFRTSASVGRTNRQIDNGLYGFFAQGKQVQINTANPSASNFDYRFVETELPLENVAYPPVIGSFVANLKILRLDSTTAKMAKPGYSVDSATGNQLIFDSTRIPLKIAKTGFLTLAAGASSSISVAYPITTKAFLDYQVNINGEGLRLPPYPNNNVDEFLVEDRIVGQSLQFRNNSTKTMQIRYVLMSEDGDGPSSGSAKVFDVQSGYTQIRRPNTAGTKDKDIILDTRAGYLPIVAQGWVPAGSMSASSISHYGTHEYVVNFSNSGFKPYVIAQAKYESIATPGRYFWQGFYAKNIEIYTLMSASTFMATVTDTQVKFFAEHGSARFEDAYRIGSLFTTAKQMNLVGFRYYIFAIPTSL